MSRTGERLAWWLLAFLLPVAFLPWGEEAFGPVKRDVFGILSMLLFASAAGGGRRRLRVIALATRESSLVFPIVSFAGWSVATTVLAGGTVEPALLDTVFGAGLTMLAVAEPDRGFRLGLVVSHTLGVLASSGYALAQGFGWDPIRWQLGFAGAAPGSTYGNPLFLADGVASAVLAGAAIAGTATRAWPIGLSVVTAGLCVPVLALTQARGAWIGTLAGLVVLAAVLRRSGAPGVRLRWRFAGGGAWALAVLALFSSPGPFNPHGISVTGEIRGAFGAAPPGLEGRRFIWEATAAMIRDRPLTGFGVGGVRREFPRYQGRLMSEARYARLPYRATGHSHQDALQVEAERGVIGAGLLVWVFAVLVAGIRGRRVTDAATMTAIATLAAWGVDGLVNGPFHLPPSSMEWWLWIAVGAPRVAPGDRPPVSAPPRLVAAVALAGAMLLARPFVRDLVGGGYAGAGQQAYEAGDPGGAVPLLTRADLLQLEDRRVHFTLGEAYLGLRLYGDAEREFVEDLERNPHVHSAWHNLGLAQFAQRRYADAARSFRQAETANPADGETRRMLARAERAARRETGRSVGEAPGAW